MYFSRYENKNNNNNTTLIIRINGPFLSAYIETIDICQSRFMSSFDVGRKTINYNQKWVLESNKVKDRLVHTIRHIVRSSDK